MKIEEAVLYLLAEKNGGMKAEQLADEINRRHLCARRDGAPISAIWNTEFLRGFFDGTVFFPILPPGIQRCAEHVVKIILSDSCTVANPYARQSSG